MLRIYDAKNHVCSTMNVNDSCRGCYKNMSSNDPAMINQRQKIIQKTVRINSSLYTMNIAGLNVYQSPAQNYQLVEQAGSTYIIPPGLNWNQMSDRARPSHQVVKSGSYGSNSLRGTKLRNRPGAMSPGGFGVDIKHNSYERYLNRIKGKGLLKKGNVQINYGQKMTGGKDVKFSIVNNCDCKSNIKQNIYANDLTTFNDAMYDVKQTFYKNQSVLVRKNKYTKIWHEGTIIEIFDNIYLIDFGIGIPEEINISVYPIISNFKKNTKCDSSDPQELINFIENNNICAKEQLLETGIFI
jgi:hypothetical protein